MCLHWGLPLPRLRSDGRFLECGLVGLCGDGLGSSNETDVDKLSDIRMYDHTLELRKQKHSREETLINTSVCDNCRQNQRNILDSVSLQFVKTKCH